MRTRVVAAFAVVSGLLLALTGCGTVLLTNNFVVTFNDPAGVLGEEPIQVSIFDPSMGQSAEWAAKSMGSTTSAAPYTTSFTTTASRLIGDDNPAPTVGVGLEIPGLTDAGYYALTLTPHQTENATVDGQFVPYATATNPPRMAPLPVDVSASQIDQGWNLTLVINVPTTYQQPKPSGPR